MSLQIVCAACRKAYRVRADAAGKHVRCPGGHVLAVPESDPSSTLPVEPDHPVAARSAGLGLALVLLGLLLLAGLGVCLFLLLGDNAVHGFRQAPDGAAKPEAATPRTEQAAPKPRQLPRADRPTKDNLDTKTPAPAAPAKEAAPPNNEPPAPVVKAPNGRETKPAPPRLMAGMPDRLDRDQLDRRSSASDAGGPTPPVWDGHTNHVRRVAVTDDGRYVVSVSGDLNRKTDRPADNSIRVWDARTGQQVHKLEGFPEALDGLSISPGGRFALFSFSGHWEGTKYVPTQHRGVFLLDIQSKRLIGPGPASAEVRPFFTGLKAQVWSTAFSPDLKTVLAADRSSAVTLWEAQTGRQIGGGEIPAAPGEFRGAKWVKSTPDGHHFVVVNADRTVRVISTDGRLGAKFPDSHLDAIWALDVAPAKDGSVWALTGGGSRERKDHTGWEPGDKDYGIRLWDLKRGQVLRLFRGHQRPVSCVAFCPDGRRFVSGSHDRALVLWDLEGVKEPREIGRHEGAVRSVAVSPDGRWCVSGGADCRIRFWRIPVTP